MKVGSLGMLYWNDNNGDYCPFIDIIWQKYHFEYAKNDTKLRFGPHRTVNCCIWMILE